MIGYTSHLRHGLPSRHFPFCFPTKTPYAPLLFPVRATRPAQPWSSSLCCSLIQGTAFRSDVRALWHFGLSQQWLCRLQPSGIRRRVASNELFFAVKMDAASPNTLIRGGRPSMLEDLLACPHRAVLMLVSVHAFLMLVSCWNWLLRRYKSEVSRRDRCLPTKRAQNNLNSVGDLVDHTYKCLSVLITLRPCWFNSRNVWVRTSCSRPYRGFGRHVFI